MGKIVLFSDLHAHSWSEFSATIEYEGKTLNSRLVDALKVIKQIERYVTTHNQIHNVIFAGDLFHRKRLVDIPVFNMIIQHMAHLADNLADKLYVLVGNHDQSYRDGSDHGNSVLALASHPNICVADDMMSLPNKWCLIPYRKDKNELLKMIEYGERVNCACYVMHVGIDGAVTGASEFKPKEPLTVLELPARPVYAGHYHFPQRLPKKNVTYIGAPLEHIRGDGFHKERGFIVVDGDDPTKFERVPIVGPRFKRVKVGTDRTVKGAFVDLVIEDAGTDVQAEVTKLTKAGARAVVPIYAVAPKSTSTRLKIKTEKGKLPTVDELCDAYIQQHADDLSVTRLKEIAGDALREAEGNENG